MKKFMTTLTTSLKLCILAIFSVAISLCSSNNASAYVYEFEGKKTDIYVSKLHTDWPGDWTLISGSGAYVFGTTDSSNDFWTPEITFNAFSVKTNDYVVLEYSTYSTGEMPGSCLTGYGVWDVVDCSHNFQRIDNNEFVKKWWSYCDTASTSGCSTWNIYPQEMGGAQTTYVIDNYRYILRFGGTSLTNNTKIKLGGPIISSTISNNRPKLVKFSPGAVFEHGAMLNDILTFLEENNEAEEMKQNRQEGEQAQQDANTNGQSSSQSATTDGQSLLQAFQSFLGALTNASPGNCNINMDTGFIDFGVVNLCSISPPPAFQAISSIVVIGFAIPLSLACARKIIELFRGFQS